MRTDFLNDNSTVIARRSIADYTAAQASLDLHRDGMNGKQAGDPERLAALILRVAGMAEPPLHLFVGRIAHDFAQQKLAQVRRDIEAWREAGEATDFA